jgi:hypothetical protein
MAKHIITVSDSAYSWALSVARRVGKGWASILKEVTDECVANRKEREVHEQRKSYGRNEGKNMEKPKLSLMERRIAQNWEDKELSDDPGTIRIAQFETACDLCLESEKMIQQGDEIVFKRRPDTNKKKLTYHSDHEYEKNPYRYR